MKTLTDDEITRLLSESHQAVLSVSRESRGPIAVPMSFLYEEGLFKMITYPGSQHGKLMQEHGRASLTVHDEQNDPTLITQWYVFAEGPIWFTEEDPEPLLRGILVKDRGREHIEEWMKQSMATVGPVAILRPERLSGYWGTSRITPKDRSSG